METIPDTFPSLFGGYTVLWLILGCYIFTLIRRVAKLEKLAEEKRVTETRRAG
jgi:CcmD family protein